MISSDIRDLINRAIDGECTPEESLKLQSILASNPEARKFHADLQVIARGMAEMTRVDPPPTLKPGILRAIEEKKRMPYPRRERARPPWLEALSLRPILAFAGGAVTGIAVFALASGVVGGRGTDSQDFMGSLILHGSSNVTFTRGNVLTAKKGSSSATVETSLADQLAIVRILVDSPGAVTATVQIDPGLLHLEAVQPIGSTQSHIRIQDSELILEDIPSGGFAILYSTTPGSAGTLHLTLAANGEEMFSDTVSLARK